LICSTATTHWGAAAGKMSGLIYLPSSQLLHYPSFVSLLRVSGSFRETGQLLIASPISLHKLSGEFWFVGLAKPSRKPTKSAVKHKVSSRTKPATEKKPVSKPIFSNTKTITFAVDANEAADKTFVSVTTDKFDYLSGETVHVTGTNRQPGATDFDDGGGANQDRSIQNGAVCLPPQAMITADAGNRICAASWPTSEGIL
jgi:hypothetical protein